MSNQIKNETSARYPRNIYFSADAWKILEKPVFENNKQLGRSAKVNRAILNNLSRVKSETQVEVEGLSINLKKVSKGLKILKCLSDHELEYRFDNYIQVVDTIISSLQNKLET